MKIILVRVFAGTDNGIELGQKQLDAATRKGYSIFQIDPVDGVAALVYTLVKSDGPDELWGANGPIDHSDMDADNG